MWPFDLFRAQSPQASAPLLPAYQAPRAAITGDPRLDSALYDLEARNAGETPQGNPPTDTFVDLPVTALGRWNLHRIRSALDGQQLGQFNEAAMLTESMLGDGKVQSALNGRLKGITLRHLHIEPAEGDRGGKYAKWVEWLWETVLTDDVLDQALSWTTIMGFGLTQRCWESTYARRLQDVWVPYLKPWHPQYTYYDIMRRQYVAQTADSIEYIDPQDPQWWLFTPWGEYRGWLRGAIRSCAVPWIVRQYAIRDAARFSEAHGMPIKVLEAPAQSNSTDKTRMLSSVRSMGNASTILLPQQTGPDGAGWKLSLLEARDRSWESFFALIDNCDREIQQVIRGTNLTSEVQGGSYAAAQVHADEDSGYADSDCRKLVESFRSTAQLFLGYNFGAPDMVPKMWLEAPDKPDLLALAQAQQFAVTTYTQAKAAGLNLDPVKHCERFSMALKSVSEPEIVETDGDESDEDAEDGSATGHLRLLGSAE